MQSWKHLWKYVRRGVFSGSFHTLGVLKGESTFTQPTVLCVCGILIYSWSSIQQQHVCIHLVLISTVLKINRPATVLLIHLVGLMPTAKGRHTLCHKSRRLNPSTNSILPFVVGSHLRRCIGHKMGVAMQPRKIRANKAKSSSRISDSLFNTAAC